MSDSSNKQFVEIEVSDLQKDTAVLRRDIDNVKEDIEKNYVKQAELKGEQIHYMRWMIQLGWPVLATVLGAGAVAFLGTFN